MDLSSLYTEIFKKCQSNDYSSLLTEELKALIQSIEEAMRLVDREALFSTNEELDDITTESLKYLFLRYYHGKCLINIKDMDFRIENLNAGKRSLSKYIDNCKMFRILHESEAARLEENVKPLNAEEKRAYKIEKFKREKAAKKRIQEISRFLAITKNDETIDYEEEQRELYTLTLQSYARDALDEIDMIDEELVMLQFRKQQSESDPNKNGGNSGPDSALNASLPPPGDRPGLSVTKTYKVNGKLMMSRETVKSTVFGPGIAPPTISLEEFADMERAAAEERARKQGEAPKGPRKYNQLVADGDEDDQALVDEATLEDRKWDDWKDENPRGWGNKMGKRF